jgi:hypothetical protein
MDVIIFAKTRWATFTLVMGYIDIKFKKARKVTTSLAQEEKKLILEQFLLYSSIAP